MLISTYESNTTLFICNYNCSRWCYNAILSLLYYCSIVCAICSQLNITTLTIPWLERHALIYCFDLLETNSPKVWVLLSLKAKSLLINSVHLRRHKMCLLLFWSCVLHLILFIIITIIIILSPLVLQVMWNQNLKLLKFLFVFLVLYII